MPLQKRVAAATEVVAVVASEVVVADAVPEQRLLLGQLQKFQIGS